MQGDREARAVEVNCRVTIRGFERDGVEETYRIVDDADANLRENKLPANNPLARALIGACVGDEIPFDPPGGRVHLKVVDIEPIDSAG